MTGAFDLPTALADAVAVALRDLAGAAATPASPGPRADERFVTALPVRTAAGDGFFALAAPRPVATALARAVLGAACPDPDPDLVRDALGELLNVIAGQAKTRLHGTPFHFTLGTPAPADPEAVAGAGLHLAFACPFGPFDLAVALPN